MQIKLFFKGFIIGLGKIVPGVSGALFACLFGVYELIIECLSNPKNIIKKFNLTFPLGIGIVFAIIFSSNIVSYLFSNYYVNSMSFFIGILTFSVLSLIKNSSNQKYKIRDYFLSSVLTISIISIILIDFKGSIRLEENYIREFISLFLCGIIDAGSTIIPGVSGSALLMMFGYYEIILNSIALLELKVLIPFLIGLIIGLLLIAKLMNYFVKNYRNIVNITILFFSCFSVVYLLINTILKITKFSIVPIIIFILGSITSFILEKKLN